MSQNARSFSMSWSGKLFDDDSVREKLTVMTKLEAIEDDSRNPDVTSADAVIALDGFLELGKTYRFTITAEEV